MSSPAEINSGGRRFANGGAQLEQAPFPKISVITVVRNGEKTIRQTIESVLRQSWPNIEYILIDGGSSDRTVKIIREFGNKIDYWISEPDNGIFHAMNKGIRQATGDLIGILNADDWYEDGALEKVAHLYQNSAKETVIHGMMRNFLDEEFYSVKGNSTRVLKYDMIQHPTCFIPKTVYQKFGVYNEQLNYSADYDLILRYVNQGVRFQFIEEVLTNFRLGGASSTNKAQLEMINVMKNNRIISKSEAKMRATQLRLTFMAKSLLRK